MGLIFNGTDVKEVIYNGIVLDKVVYNGVTVFEKIVGLPDGTIGLFYGGSNDSSILNKVTRIDSNGAMIGTETGVGTARYSLAGAGL